MSGAVLLAACANGAADDAELACPRLAPQELLSALASHGALSRHAGNQAEFALRIWSSTHPKLLDRGSGRKLLDKVAKAAKAVPPGQAGWKAGADKGRGVDGGAAARRIGRGVSVSGLQKDVFARLKGLGYGPTMEKKVRRGRRMGHP